MTTGDTRRRSAEAALRICLTVVALACFYGGYHYFQSSLHPPDFTSPASAGYLPRDTAQDGGRAIRFPWPAYPGATVVQRHEIPLDPYPLQQQVLEIAASPEQILDFYRGRLRGDGYRDITDRTLRLDPETVARGDTRVSLNSEAFARGYDRMRHSLLLMSRGDRTVMVRIRPGPKSWKHSVHLVSYPQNAVEKLAARNRGRDIGGGIVEIPTGQTPRQMGGEAYSTVLYGGNMGVADLYDALRVRLENEGWAPRFGDTDRPLKVEGTVAGYFTRRNEERLVFVAPRTGGGPSVASVTTIRAAR